jgi:16S rRNA (cytosine967-C5)-methyltransferase
MSRTRANARQVAAEVVRRALDEGVYAGALLDALLSSTPLSDEDRALATELSYGTLRWAGALDESVRRALDKPQKKIDDRLRAHLLVAAYQLQHLSERIPAHAAVNEAVLNVKRERPGLAGFANAVLRHLGSAPHLQLKEGAPLDAIARATGTPLVLAQAIVDGLPVREHLPAVLALHARPPLGVYVRGGRDRRVAFLEALQQRGVSARPHAFVGGMALVDGAGAVPKLPGFDEGELIVVDPGSALTAQLVGAGRGDRILDLCAAPGTKTMLLADQVAPTGSITAVELHETRARRIEENAARLTLPVQVRVGDGTDRALLGEQEFDAVLVDAPCSGLGTTRRRPEIAWRVRTAEQEPIAALQRRLLDAGAERVREGGTLVYSVCTPVASEGIDIVRAFLVDHPNFTLERVSDVVRDLPASAVGPDGTLRTRPHAHDADAFFAARFTRRHQHGSDP